MFTYKLILQPRDAALKKKNEKPFNIENLICIKEKLTSRLNILQIL